MNRRRHAIAWPIAIAIGTFALHAFTLNRYGYFGDELYFIECAKHLAWGYVDQPPLVAVIAWLSAPLGYALFALRLGSALAAAATTLVVYLSARALGASRPAGATAAVAAALLPVYLTLGGVLATSSFEPFTWSLTFYALIRLLRGDDARWWLLAGASAALAFLGKYSIVLPVGTSLAAIALLPARSILATRWFAIAFALALAIMLPNLIWEQNHAWPMLGVLAGDVANRHALGNGMLFENRNLIANSISFLAEQFIYTNPLIAPLWLVGVVWLLAARVATPFRAIGLSFILLLLAAIALNAKGYYVAGVYGTLLAAGAAALDRVLARARVAALVASALVLLSIPTVPLTVPLLSIRHFIDYSAMIGLTGRDGAPPRLVHPMYADELDWDASVARIAQVYHGLPRESAGRTTLYADTYAYASAINFYGPRYGLPRAISAQNTYYLWGYGDNDGSRLLLVGASQADLIKTLYRTVTLVAVIKDPLRWEVEGPLPLYYCEHPIAPLASLWPRLRWYGG